MDNQDQPQTHGAADNMDMEVPVPPPPTPFAIPNIIQTLSSIQFLSDSDTAIPQLKKLREVSTEFYGITSPRFWDKEPIENKQVLEILPRKSSTVPWSIMSSVNREFIHTYRALNIDDLGFIGADGGSGAGKFGQEVLDLLDEELGPHLTRIWIDLKSRPREQQNTLLIPFLRKLSTWKNLIKVTLDVVDFKLTSEMREILNSFSASKVYVEIIVTQTTVNNLMKLIKFLNPTTASLYVDRIEIRSENELETLAKGTGDWFQTSVSSTVTALHIYLEDRTFRPEHQDQGITYLNQLLQIWKPSKFEFNQLGLSAGRKWDLIGGLAILRVNGDYLEPVAGNLRDPKTAGNEKVHWSWFLIHLTIVGYSSPINLPLLFGTEEEVVEGEQIPTRYCFLKEFRLISIDASTSLFSDPELSDEDNLEKVFGICQLADVELSLNREDEAGYRKFREQKDYFAEVIAEWVQELVTYWN